MKRTQAQCAHVYMQEEINSENILCYRASCVAKTSLMKTINFQL